MTSEQLIALATGLSAVSTLAALAIAWLGLKESRVRANEGARRTAIEIDAEIQNPRHERNVPGSRRPVPHGPASSTCIGRRTCERALPDERCDLPRSGSGAARPLVGSVPPMGGRDATTC